MWSRMTTSRFMGSPGRNTNLLKWNWVQTFWVLRNFFLPLGFFQKGRVHKEVSSHSSWGIKGFRFLCLICRWSINSSSKRSFLTSKQHNPHPTPHTQLGQCHWKMLSMVKYCSISQIMNLWVKAEETVPSFLADNLLLARSATSVMFVSPLPFHLSTQCP